MDRRAPAPPSEREIMFCHQCENEWYRDEHGIECPECGGDFCEAIEAGNDPREPTHHPRGEEFAPDPDEDDIDQFAWQEGGSDQVPDERFRARYQRTITQDVDQAQGSGLMGLLGSAFRMASDIIQPQSGEAAGQQREGQPPASPSAQSTTSRAISPDGGTTITRQVRGNNFSFTMTSTTRSGINLQPRDPNNPQPVQQQPEAIDTMMQQILGNIGVVPTGMQGPHHPSAGFPIGPAGFMFNDPHVVPGGPSPFPAGLFQLLGLPVGGVHGDAVYSQEGLDRIITQLMEQHQTGNAPGPASENAIKSLPTRSINEKDLGDTGTADCSICMESVALGDTVTVLPCEHWFHYDCIEAWLSEHDTCPHCRQGIMPKSDANASAPRQASQAPLNDMNRRTQIPGSYPSSEQNRSSSRATVSSPEQRASTNDVYNGIREAFGGNGNASSSNRPS